MRKLHERKASERVLYALLVLSALVVWFAKAQGTI